MCTGITTGTLAVDLTTRDHRLELIKGGDVRGNLRSAMRELPEAPCYIILCLDAGDADK